MGSGEKGGRPVPDGESIRTGMSVAAIRQAFLDNLFCVQGRFPAVATRNDNYMALAYTVRDRILRNWIDTGETYVRSGSKVVCYLSAEFLLGPHLGNNLVNLGIRGKAERAMRELGLSLADLLEQEEEPGLGNGGLGRLAACFLDSLSTLKIPAFGYGIRYEFGIFDQEIRDGWQVEVTDKWLRFGNPWEIERPEIAFRVDFGGRTEAFRDGEGRTRVRWIPERRIKGVAHDTPIPGYGVRNVNLLRLWKAEAEESFDFQAFNVGDYYRAVDEKIVSENVTKVLYPNDEPVRGRRLRLAQQYFLVSCSLQDMVRLHLASGRPLAEFPDRFAAQLNDTHPALAVPELMRLLVDVHGMDWETAWDATRRTFGYTNHTLLPEAMEKWPLPLFGSMLPRHLEIVYEINRRFLDEVRANFPGDGDRVARLSLIDEAGEKSVRMAHLACVGSRAVNGVARLHTELLKKTVLRDFHEMWPERFSNKTNGVTPRRFLLLCNPGLSALLSEAAGEGWPRDLSLLRKIEPLADDPAFRERWRAVRRENKRLLAEAVLRRTGIAVDPDSLFDVQVKRIHEYKRQHLNVLHVIDLYRRMKENPALPAPPRTVLFGGKAAPGYFMAKRIIRLVTGVAEAVNADPEVAGRLRVVFFPDYNVKNGQRIFPAADLSEQISTAGKEASGTGNMKFTMNGAVTIGTLDGANVEIRGEVGAENFFLFGLTAGEVEERRARGYDPRRIYEESPRLRAAVDMIASGAFSRGDREVFRPLVESLLGRDEYLLFADFASYVEAQERAGRTFLDPDAWTRMSILNTARSGAFSSDRTIREYCGEIWGAVAVDVPETGAGGSL